MGQGQDGGLAIVLDLCLRVICFLDPAWVLAGVLASEKASAGDSGVDSESAAAADSGVPVWEASWIILTIQ